MRRPGWRWSLPLLAAVLHGPVLPARAQAERLVGMQVLRAASRHDRRGGDRVGDRVAALDELGDGLVDFSNVLGLWRADPQRG